MSKQIAAKIEEKAEAHEYVRRTEVDGWEAELFCNDETFNIWLTSPTQKTAREILPRSMEVWDRILRIFKVRELETPVAFFVDNEPGQLRVVCAVDFRCVADRRDFVLRAGKYIDREGDNKFFARYWNLIAA